MGLSILGDVVLGDVGLGAAAPCASAAVAATRTTSSSGGVVAPVTMPPLAAALASGGLGSGCILGTGRSACANSAGAVSLGAMTTRSPIFVRPQSSAAKRDGSLMQPCEAG